MQEGREGEAVLEKQVSILRAGGQLGSQVRREGNTFPGRARLSAQVQDVSSMRSTQTLSHRLGGGRSDLSPAPSIGMGPLTLAQNHSKGAKGTPSTGSQPGPRPMLGFTSVDLTESLRSKW